MPWFVWCAGVERRAHLAVGCQDYLLLVRALAALRQGGHERSVERRATKIPRLIDDVTSSERA